MQNDKNKFPVVSATGAVSILGNTINSKGDSYMFTSDVNIDQIQYVYVIVNAKKESFLFLFDHHQHTIPTNHAGFESVYKQLSNRFSFDDELFFKTITNQQVAKKQIWRRTYKPTYDVLQTQHADYGKGFEILSPEPQFISWDTTSADLEINDAVYFDISPYGHSLLKYKYPIRFGNIVLYDIASYFNNVRKDAPVLEFHIDCFDEKATDESYNQLKEVLLRDLGLDVNRSGYERTDQKNIYFDVDNMSLSICYTYDSDHMYNCGYTSLTIQNRREYPELLIDATYESEIVVSDFLLISGSVSMRNDYKTNEKVKRRPLTIAEQFKDKTVIWMDDINNKIGFACGAYSQVYTKDEIKALSIGNILPARGRGGSDLYLILEQDKNHYGIFSASCHFFDRYVDEIVQLTHKKLSFEPEYHDC